MRQRNMCPAGLNLITENTFARKIGEAIRIFHAKFMAEIVFRQMRPFHGMIQSIFRAKVGNARSRGNACATEKDNVRTRFHPRLCFLHRFRLIHGFLLYGAPSPDKGDLAFFSVGNGNQHLFCSSLIHFQHLVHGFAFGLRSEKRGKRHPL